MFIRSQNKEELIDLEECAGLKINYYEYKAINVRVSICEYICDNSLGEYESKERCLEIMDEICAAIEEGQTIYYMPEE